MIFRRLLIFLALIALHFGWLEAQNPLTPYPQRNALDYLLNWGDSLRVGYRGTLSSWGSNLTFGVSGGAQYMVYPYTEDKFMPLSRIHLGWWFTPVSGIELGGSFGVSPAQAGQKSTFYRAAEVNYLFNISKYATRNAGFERFSLIGLVGAQLGELEHNSKQEKTWGGHIALRGSYHLPRGMNLFIEPRLSYYNAMHSSVREYTLAPSLALGMQMRLRNINSYGSWLENTGTAYSKMGFALKTNLLYGGLTQTPNLGLEVRLSSRFTLEAYTAINPFEARKSDPAEVNKHFLYQLSGRYWFDQSFDGAFASLNGTYAHYQLAGGKLPRPFKRERTDTGYKGNAYGPGVSVGYLWRLGQRWGIEAELGLGYLSVNYDKHDYKAQTQEPNLHKNYWGPTKAAISMVYLLDPAEMKINFASWFPKSDELLPFNMALKTNLLYSAVALTPNIGVEIGLSERVTLDASVGYNPWKLNSNANRKLVHSMYQLGPRYWFKERFDGTFVGSHLLYTKYNISHHRLPMLFGKESGNYRFEGNGYGAGLSVGHLWRVGSRWGVEAEVGAGYARLNYDKYDCGNCEGKVEKGGGKNYFGPTKAALSVVYLLNAPKVTIPRIDFFPVRENLEEYKWAVKTNLLYGAVALAPNAGVEYGLSDRVTLGADASYNPWHLNSNAPEKLVHAMYQVGARYWKRKRFDGFFAGSHLLYTQYNISYRSLPRLFGKDSGSHRFEGNGYGAGLSVGHLWRVGSRWGVEAEVGVGYMRLHYDKYDCGNCSSRVENNVSKNYVGPTKAAVSLVYMIK